MTAVRTRYAPSPTGDPHVGNIRTAIFAWAFARANGGTFLVRIEDTDQARSTPGSVEAIYESLRWLGIDWDEGPDVGGPHAPYVQSERLPMYRAAAEKLLSEGHAYPCFCSSERLDAMRASQAAAKKPPGYDGLCRAIPAPEAGRRRQSEPHVVRFKMKREGQTVLDDIVRGRVVFENALQDDFVALKSDGFPTYHLALIVDDTDMRITHAIRAEDWLPSAPKHLQVYEAMGYEPTRFAHLPLIVGPDRKKLSKRTGDTALLDYGRNGYLPAAMLNFLILLGWSLDDKTTIISRDELLAHFTLERVVPNPALFDMDRLNHLNGHYIREMGADTWLETVRTWASNTLPEHVLAREPGDTLAAAAPLLQERTRTLAEIGPSVEFLYGPDAPEFTLDQLTERAASRDEATRILDAALVALDAVGANEWSAATVETAIRGIEATIGQKLRKFVPVLYVATQGRAQGLPLFDSLAILGRDRSLHRLRAARARAG